MYYSVDALENGTARLVDDAGGSPFVPAADLPPRCGAGGMCWSRGMAYGVPRRRKQSGAKRAPRCFCSRYWSVKTPRAMEALNENCFGDRPVRRFKQRHHCDGAALCGPAAQARARGCHSCGRRAVRGQDMRSGAPYPGVPEAHRKQGMCFAKPDEEAYYTAFKDADIVHFYMPFRFCRRGEELARQMGIPTVAAFHVQPENITSSIFWAKTGA